MVLRTASSALRSLALVTPSFVASADRSSRAPGGPCRSREPCALAFDLELEPELELLPGAATAIDAAAIAITQAAASIFHVRVIGDSPFLDEAAAGRPSSKRLAHGHVTSLRYDCGFSETCRRPPAAAIRVGVDPGGGEDEDGCARRHDDHQQPGGAGVGSRAKCVRHGEHPCRQREPVDPPPGGVADPAARVEAQTGDGGDPAA